mgnify:CR=1 FL=1
MFQKLPRLLHFFVLLCPSLQKVFAEIHVGNSQNLKTQNVEYLGIQQWDFDETKTTKQCLEAAFWWFLNHHDSSLRSRDILQFLFWEFPKFPILHKYCVSLLYSFSDIPTSCKFGCQTHPLNARKFVHWEEQNWVLRER